MVSAQSWPHGGHGFNGFNRPGLKGDWIEESCDDLFWAPRMWMECDGYFVWFPKIRDLKISVFHPSCCYSRISDPGFPEISSQVLRQWWYLKIAQKKSQLFFYSRKSYRQKMILQDGNDTSPSRRLTDGNQWLPTNHGDETPQYQPWFTLSGHHEPYICHVLVPFPWLVGGWGKTPLKNIKLVTWDDDRNSQYISGKMPNWWQPVTTKQELIYEKLINIPPKPSNNSRGCTVYRTKISGRH